MNKLKHYVGICALVALAVTNIAALNVEDMNQEEEAVLPCWLIGYTRKGQDHFACSGIAIDCAPVVYDHDNCLEIVFLGRPDIIVTPPDDPAESP